MPQMFWLTHIKTEDAIYVQKWILFCFPHTGILGYHGDCVDKNLLFFGSECRNVLLYTLLTKYNSDWPWEKIRNTSPFMKIKKIKHEQLNEIFL